MSDRGVDPGTMMVLCAALGVMVVVAGPGVGATVASGDAGAGPADAGPSVLDAVAPDPRFDAVTVRIAVQPDGDARWNLSYRYELGDRNGQAGFDRARRNVTNPPGEFVGEMEATAVAAAERETGRSMDLENAGVVTDMNPVANEGIVRYRFTWRNFAATQGDGRVVVGDAIAGYRLDRNQSLVVEWDDSLRREAVSPAPDATRPGGVRWTGRVTFLSQHPRIELVTTGGTRSGGLPLVPVAGAVLALLVVVGGWYGRSRWVGDAGASGDRPAGAGSAATGDADGTAVAAGPDGDPDSDGTEEPPEELLTDEERVLRLVESAGGRMKQQDLIDAVEWSRTKVSDTVNEMHEAGRIEIYRLGRENVLALPGEIEI